jgi:hypothetical protein
MSFIDNITQEGDILDAERSVNDLIADYNAVDAGTYTGGYNAALEVDRLFPAI